MLDPTQTLALTKSRISGIRVSGVTGSGKSTLASALASDAARRGLQCLLFNVPTPQARSVPLPTRARGLPPTLGRRFLDAPAAPTRVAPTADVNRQDLVALRAAQDPDGASLALRILSTARQVAARHDLGADEVESLARPVAVDEAALSMLALALDDARTFADAAMGGNERPGATLGMIREAISGGTPSDGVAALMLAETDGPLDTHLAGLAAKADGEAVALVHLRDLAVALGDLIGRPGTVREAYVWASECARALDAAVTMLQDHANLADALATCPPESPEAKVVSWCLSNRNDKPSAIMACRRLAGKHEAQAEVLRPFLAEHGDRLCSTVHDVTSKAHTEATSPASLGALAQSLRDGRHAARRFREALPLLKERLPTGMLASLSDVPIDEAKVPAVGGPPPERLQAADTLRALRAEFARLGYGDVLSPPENFEERIRAARRPAARTAGIGRPVPAEVLDILLPDGDAETEAPTPEVWDRFVMHVAPAAPEASPPDLFELEKLGFDVVVIDDAHLLPAETLAVLRRCAPVVHEVGVPLSADTLHLGRSHRQVTSGLLAMAADGAPSFLGSPSRGGLLVRTWNGSGIDGRHAVRFLRMEAEKAHLSVAVLDAMQAAAYVDEHDVIIVHGAGALAAARNVAAHARLAVVACAPNLPQEQRAEPAEGPETPGLRALGWELVDSACDGRIYAKAGKVAALATEPHWLDRGDEDLLSRLGRLRALGWNPVVSWTASERTTSDLDRMLAANAVDVGIDVMAILGGDLPVRPTLQRIRADAVPYPETRMDASDEIRWRLRWLRDEMLMPATPYVDPAHCILRDEMIEAFLRTEISEKGHLTRLPSQLREQTDGCQTPVLQTIIDIKDRMPAAPAPARTRRAALSVVLDGQAEVPAETPPAFMIPTLVASEMRPPR